MPNDLADDLAQRLRDGDTRLLGRVLSVLERGGDRAPDVLAALRPHLGTARVVGFTGAPGAGKSTLVNAVVRTAREQGRKVGVIAVDPSSPVTGGAVLGDRFRMSEHTGDPGVFVRSVASRGHLGGLSPAAVRMIDALDAAGMDLVILETVGAGQNEVEVAEVADVKVVVCAPGLGDDVQALKAGILEIADVLVVNKADLPLADRTQAQLSAMLALRAGAGADVPVLKTVATDGTGVAELMAALWRDDRVATPARRRDRRARALLAQSVAEAVRRRIQGGGDRLAEALCADILDNGLSPDQAADHWLKAAAR